MKWETKQPVQPAVPYMQLVHGPLMLTVSPAQSGDGTVWQHLMLSFGVHSEASVADCQQTWPREAIVAARAQLDEFERSLDSDNKRQTAGCYPADDSSRTTNQYAARRLP